MCVYAWSMHFSLSFSFLITNQHTPFPLLSIRLTLSRCGLTSIQEVAPTAKDVEDIKQAQLDEDIRERDEFVQRMLEKEDSKTKKLGGVSPVSLPYNRPCMHACLFLCASILLHLLSSNPIY